MPPDKEFARTGPLPERAYVGFVSNKMAQEGVIFTVRSEGDGIASASTIADHLAAHLVVAAASESARAVSAMSRFFRPG